MGFKMIYWTPMSGSYFFLGFYFGKMWNFFEKRPFFRADMARLGNTTRADMAGLGSIGLKRRPCTVIYASCNMNYNCHLVHF